ncbi:MAG: hypothetical protein KUG53_01290, partial [Pseudomonadales bacterium]|nr:hypothetical protein [Pseudomonadales bacterium]
VYSLGVSIAACFGSKGSGGITKSGTSGYLTGFWNSSGSTTKATTTMMSAPTNRGLIAPNLTQTSNLDQKKRSSYWISTI